MFTRHVHRVRQVLCSANRYYRKVNTCKDVLRNNTLPFVTLVSTPILMIMPFLAVSMEGDQSLNIKLAEETKLAYPTVEEAITKADSLYSDGKYAELVDLLRSYRHIDNVEIHWRLVRALYNHAKHTSPKEDKPQLTKEAYEIVSEAINHWDDHYAIHKWFAVVLDEYAALSGAKARISQLQTIKTHLLRTVELNPKDATTWYILGEYCYQLADMPWYQIQIATALFGRPPTSTFEEALRYFIKAEETEPLFFSLNLLMLGKTYYKLGKTDKALFYLEKAQQHPKTNDDDMTAYTEATKLLQKINKK